jgi:hypothetical protein
MPITAWMRHKLHEITDTISKTSTPRMLFQFSKDAHDPALIMPLLHSSSADMVPPLELSSQAPHRTLGSLCDLLMDSLGHFLPYPLCLALLVSAASVPTEPPALGMGALKGRLPRTGEGRRQLNMLVTQPPQDPTLVARQVG